MTSKQQFEKWLTDNYPWVNTTGSPPGIKNLLWHTWESSRQSAVVKLNMASKGRCYNGAIDVGVVTDALDKSGIKYVLMPRSK